MARRISSLALAGLLFAALLQPRQSTAQIDLTGTWATRVDEDNQTRVAGPNLVEYMGIPLNAAARAAALSYTPDTVSELARQCEPWPLHYLLMGPFGFRMWPTKDKATGAVVAWDISGTGDRSALTIWVDGRPAPGPQALNTLGGFITGKWQGDTLVTTATHIQDGVLTRNGVPSSDQETLTMDFTRHDELLSIFMMVQDPVYLTAPYVQSRTWAFDPTASLTDSPLICEPEEEVSTLANDHVPSYLTPADNPSLMVEHQMYDIPQKAVLGGAQTMYPQYIEQIRGQYQIPKNYCTLHCCSTGSLEDFNFDFKVLKCVDKLGNS